MKHTAEAVRRQFIEFFEERGHTFVSSAPVFPHDDPTLLFTNAGMNQFKDVFLGSGTRKYSRAVNSQKCIRVSGKHNDLEEVGLDTYHHTFFEMLGNWSFGDYFKREAITWSWDLLTNVWGLPKERLWATVFGGDEKDGLPADEEAEAIWREETDIDPTHILRCSRKDNFWEMGETGPCGPCTEIHIDRGGPDANPKDGLDPAIGVNAGNERFIELWNNVFIQFNRLDDGRLEDLPARHVDTGMGFERILSVLQGKSSNYDTDLFTPLFRALSEITGRPYGEDETTDIAFRVIADHMRAVSSALADGALPSNEGRGYVLRRLIRRASRFGRQSLGMEQPFMHRVVPTVVEVLGPAFGELTQRAEHIEGQVLAEEKSFGVTLDRGLVVFSELAERVAAKGGTTLPGKDAFELYATYGFPEDLVEQMCRERGWELDRDGWREAEQKHRAVSRAEGSFRQLLSGEQLKELQPTTSTYHEAGERGESLQTRVLGVFRDGDGPHRAVLAESPFYPEGGGQVGDAGQLVDAGGAVLFHVDDTKKLGEVVVHLGRIEADLEAGQELVARVDAQRRNATRANHTATHLMHKALRETLGDHVTQQGSYVGPDRLRFDLSHPRGITPDELERIERIVNSQIAANAQVETTVEELDAAKARGVMALFGEKYDDRVRVVDVAGWATELCGGTHVRAAGDIGLFVIASERALQAGVRRIEALTREAALERVQEQRRLLTQAAQAMKTAPEELPERIEGLQTQLKQAKKEKSKSSGDDVRGALDQVRAALEESAGVAWAVVDLPNLDVQGMRDLGERVRTLGGDLCAVLTARAGDKVPFLVLAEGAALERGLHAGKIAGELASVLGGGGGGKPNRAQGQGLRSDSVAEALTKARALVTETLAS